MENEELVEQIQAGIKPTENMEQLYLQNRSFIYQQAKKYAAYADMDDLIQLPEFQQRSQRQRRLRKRFMRLRLQWKQVQHSQQQRHSTALMRRCMLALSLGS